MPSNLNIKYGNKAGTGSAAPINSSEVTPGNIYVAENNIGNIEMYVDTPKDSGSERKRLDSRIFVGGLSDLPEGTNTSDIWNNYDIWINTTVNPNGIASAPTTSYPTGADGLMSASQAQLLNDTNNTLTALKALLDQLKIQIVSQDYWTQVGSQATLTNTLTIVLPNTAVPSGGGNYPDPENTSSENKKHIFNTINTNTLSVPPLVLASESGDTFGQ